MIMAGIPPRPRALAIDCPTPERPHQQHRSAPADRPDQKACPRGSIRAPDLCQLFEKISPAVADETFYFGNARVNIGRAAPAPAILRSQRADLSLEPVDQGEELFGGELFFEKLSEPGQESILQTALAKKPILQPVPTGYPRHLPGAEKNGKVRFVE